MKTFLSIIIFLLSLSVANAKIINVPADEATIQAGINAAIDGDTVLVADGTYTGDGSGLYGKNIVVKSQNGPLNCIIDGQGTAYVGFGDGYSYEGLNAVIEGFTVRNFFGRGFYFYAGACPTIRDNIIESCGAGGITSWGGSPVIENNIIQNNEGPGIKTSSSTAQIISNTIRGNRANYGAGISLSGSAATIMNNIIYENSSEKGGGLYCSNSSSATIINNTIIDNAAIFGCGVYIDESPMILTNNIIAFSKYKPALNLNIYYYNFKSHRNYEGANLTSIDYMFALNNKGNGGSVNFFSTSSVGGLGIDTTFQMSTGERRTVYINSKVNESGDFGGIRLVITHNNDTLVVKADGPSSFRPGSYYLTLAMDSDAVPASKEIVEIGQSSEITFCDIFGGGEGNYYSGASDFELEEIVLDGTNGNISSDPLFVDPEHGDYHLQQDSPCINAGPPDPSFNDPDGSRADMGAFYYTSGTFVHSQKGSLLPDKYHLAQNYPNPFNPVTTIEYQLPKDSHVIIRIFNITGELVKILIEEEQTAGYHKIQWNGRNENGNSVAGGLYLYHLKADAFSHSNKMIIIR